MYRKYIVTIELAIELVEPSVKAENPEGMKALATVISKHTFKEIPPEVVK